MKMAVLGLGIIGSRALANLVAKGENVRGWNRTPKQLPQAETSLQAAVEGADTISLYLKDAPAVREVAPQLPAGPLRVLNHSTIDLDTTRWLGALARERGWQMLDAPFTGSRDAAAEGKLVYYVGGEPSWIESLTPLLLKTGRLVIPCGGFGQGTVVKLATNLISACTVQALAESLAVASRHGVSASTLNQAIAHNACSSPLAAAKIPAMNAGDFTTHFSLANMQKDSRYALELATGLETPALSAVSARMEELCRLGLAEKDFSALFAPYLAAKES